MQTNQTDDVRRFARLLKHECHAGELLALLGRFGLVSALESLPQGRTIECADDGIEFHLSKDETQDVFEVSFVRFLSPEYCRGKSSRPYLRQLIGETTFPLDQQTVRSKLGLPSGTGNKIARYDEYAFEACSVRFIYPTKMNHVVFVELHAKEDPEVVTDRLGQATQLATIRDETWRRRFAFYERVFGDFERVWPAAVGSFPIVDVLSFRNDEGIVTLVTSGMSDQRMLVPDDADDTGRLELLVYLEDSSDDIVRRLRQDAMFPFAEQTYLGHGDTINWIVPLVRGSILTVDLLIYSIVAEHRRLPFPIQGETVDLLWCVPITEAELQLKRESGIDALLHVFDQMCHPRRLESFRKSYL